MIIQMPADLRIDVNSHRSCPWTFGHRQSG